MIARWMSRGRESLHKALITTLFLTSGVLPAGLSPALGQDTKATPISCLETRTAALRLNQLAEGIAGCTKFADDPAATATLRSQALHQRGLMHARRWSIVQDRQDAVRGIDDITEGLRMQTPPADRRSVLLMVRAQLYAATNQADKAAADYRAVLENDPKNRSALHGLSQVTNTVPSQ